MSSNSKLYVVATPIGNAEDITLRALRVLKEVDFVICEERKMGSKLLKGYEIKKELELLNEHNEAEQTPRILERLMIEQQTAALISDAGAPLFADPGNSLVARCHQSGIQVVPLPGASSLMGALMGSGIAMDQFLYYGFLPANKDQRKLALKKLPHQYDIIFLEAPYRLKQLLQAFRKNVGAQREAIIAYKLTMPEEKFFWGSIDELMTMTEGLPKGEFVFILKRLHKNYKRR